MVTSAADFVEALGTLGAYENALVEKIEAGIARQCVLHDNSFVTVAVDLPEDDAGRRIVFDNVARLYEAAGWGAMAYGRIKNGWTVYVIPVEAEKHWFAKQKNKNERIKYDFISYFH